jgi:hypothetical protein
MMNIKENLDRLMKKGGSYSNKRCSEALFTPAENSIT